MPDQKDWFIRERSEALASWLLTKRSDVAVRREEGRDSGADLIVELKEGDKPLSTKIFIVQVRGTVSSDKSQWMEGVKQLFKAGPYYLPACVFIINVKDNKAEYAWLAEPEVRGNTARLNFFEQGDFHPLNQDAVNQIVDRIQAWYQVLPQPATAQAS
jgi:hypothetical protein